MYSKIFSFDPFYNQFNSRSRICKPSLTMMTSPYEDEKKKQSFKKNYDT